ncbi:MAG: Maf family protein [Anaerolineales bacterium]
MLFLASQSPRRRQLLNLLQVDYQIQNGTIDETPFINESPSDYVQRLARSKAQAVAPFVSADAFILAADTTVVAEWNGTQTIIGKPKDQQEARLILTQLRGKSHFVYTALALYQRGSGKMWQDICLTEVFMRDYSDSEMEEYITSDDPLDKAGAYAIQHPGFHPVAKITGCYANVMGLPLCQVAQLLNNAAIAVHVNIPQICQQEFSIPCSGLQR